MTDPKLINTLEAKLQIDPHALDTALREHPDLFYKVASELALAISNRDESKQNLDEIEAVVDLEIRAESARLGEKTTEKEVESHKKTDKRVMSANDVFIEEKLNTARWTALKDAYEQRSYALSKLVDLYLANYYSSNQDNRTGGADFINARVEQIKQQNQRQRVKV